VSANKTFGGVPQSLRLFALRTGARKHFPTSKNQRMSQNRHGSMRFLGAAPGGIKAHYHQRPTGLLAYPTLLRQAGNWQTDLHCSPCRSQKTPRQSRTANLPIANDFEYATKLSLVACCCAPHQMKLVGHSYELPPSHSCDGPNMDGQCGIILFSG